MGDVDLRALTREALANPQDKALWRRLRSAAARAQGQTGPDVRLLDRLDRARDRYYRIATLVEDCVDAHRHERQVEELLRVRYEDLLREVRRRCHGVPLEDLDDRALEALKVARSTLGNARLQYRQLYRDGTRTRWPGVPPFLRTQCPMCQLYTDGPVSPEGLCEGCDRARGEGFCSGCRGRTVHHTCGRTPSANENPTLATGSLGDVRTLARIASDLGVSFGEFTRTAFPLLQEALQRIGEFPLPYETTWQGRPLRVRASVADLVIQQFTGVEWVDVARVSADQAYGFSQGERAVRLHLRRGSQLLAAISANGDTWVVVRDQ